MSEGTKTQLAIWGTAMFLHAGVVLGAGSRGTTALVLLGGLFVQDAAFCGLCLGMQRG